MNLILFESSEIEQPLPRTDRRATHILNVLRRRIGETFDVGMVNGPQGKATLTEITPDTVRLSFSWPASPPLPATHGITLIVGLPRPQTARDILREATTLGVDAIHFVQSARSEPSYAQSSLWTAGEWRRHVMGGAEQAFDPRLPVVSHGAGLTPTLTQLPSHGDRIALDNYEAGGPLGTHVFATGVPITVAIGSERGWAPAERELLRTHRFSLAHLGARVLRTETAVAAALAIIRSRRGLM